jgi:hypothetical protein
MTAPTAYFYSVANKHTPTAFSALVNKLTMQAMI